jgi:hypothetical protein
MRLLLRRVEAKITRAVKTPPDRMPVMTDSSALAGDVMQARAELGGMLLGDRSPAWTAGCGGELRNFSERH